MYLCVRNMIRPLSTIVLLEFGTGPTSWYFYFLFTLFCSVIIVKRIFVMNKTPNAFHIEVSIMILITIILKTYNISKQKCFPYTISI